MPTKDDFTPDYPLPVFLSQHADVPEQPGIGIAWDRAVISSRILKTSILVVTAAAFAIVWMEIQSVSLRTSRLRWSIYRRFSLAPISRRQQFNQPPALRLCRRLQGDTPPVNSGANPESARHQTTRPPQGTR